MDSEMKTASAQEKNIDTAATGNQSSGSYNLNFRIPRNLVEDSLQKLEIPMIHDRIQTEFESDRSYHLIAEKIISASQKHLAQQQKDKMELRKLFAIVFCGLVVVEVISAILMIFLDGATKIPIEISDVILQLYVTSVVLQTLGTMGMMISFSFVSKEETRIVGLLNQIIQNYQKVNLDDLQEPNQQNGFNGGKGMPDRINKY